MNQYTRHHQISTAQLAANAAALEADRQARPLHPRRLEVEDQLWQSTYAALFAGVRRNTQRWHQLTAEMNTQANQLLGL